MQLGDQGNVDEFGRNPTRLDRLAGLGGQRVEDLVRRCGHPEAPRQKLAAITVTSPAELRHQIEGQDPGGELFRPEPDCQPELRVQE